MKKIAIHPGQKITPGKWEVMKFLNDDSSIEEITIDDGIEGGTEVICEILFNKNKEYKEDHLPTVEVAVNNAKAIKAAINNTYKVGINPEAVEEMKDVLMMEYNYMLEAVHTEESMERFVRIRRALRMAGAL